MHQMGLSVEAALVTGSAKARVHHRRDRAFAFSARDMNRAQLLMRIADQLERQIHALELINLAPPFEGIEPIKGFRHALHRMNCRAFYVAGKSRESILCNDPRGCLVRISDRIAITIART